MPAARPHVWHSAAVLKSRDERRLTATAVLSSPAADLAGDVVVPAGLNFREHARDPWVDLEHGRHPDAGPAPVGWARDSFGEPGGAYSVQWADLPYDDGQTYRLPVGTTHFDPSDRLQSQVFALVAQDALPGVSLEFRPDWSVAKALGWSQLEGRHAYRFPRADVVRWTHCVVPVNTGSLVAVAKSVAPGQVPQRLGTILSLGKIGSEPLHPTILKALDAYRPRPDRSTAFVEKAMDELDDGNAYDDAVQPEGEEAAGDAPANNGVAAIYAHSQTIIDACDQLEADLESSDNPALIKDGKKLCEEARAFAEKAKAKADGHDAKIQAAKGGAEEEPAEEPEEEPDGDEVESEDADMTEDDDGTFKAVRRCYKPILKAVKAKRFSLREIAAGVKKAAGEDDPKARAEFERQLARLKKFAAKS